MIIIVKLQNELQQQQGQQHAGLMMIVVTPVVQACCIGTSPKFVHSTVLYSLKLAACTAQTGTQCRRVWAC